MTFNLDEYLDGLGDNKIPKRNCQLTTKGENQSFASHYGNLFHHEIFMAYQEANFGKLIAKASTSIRDLLVMFRLKGIATDASMIEQEGLLLCPDISNIDDCMIGEVKHCSANSTNHGYLSVHGKLNVLKLAGVPAKPIPKDAPGTFGALVYPEFYVIYKSFINGLISYETFPKSKRITG